MKKVAAPGRVFCRCRQRFVVLASSMSLRASLVSGAVCLLLAVPPAAASSGDHDPDQDATAAAGPTPRRDGQAGRRSTAAG